MAEYIEREKVIEELNNIATDYIKDNSIQCSIASGVVINIRDTVILEQPTADVVPVVRCKDCKYCEHINDEFAKDWYQCKRRGNFAQKKPDNYCSYGERRCSG